MKARSLGWLLFVLAWIPILIANIAFEENSPGGNTLMVVGIGSIVLGMILVFAGGFSGGVSNLTVAANGEPATATILKIAQTGSWINNNPQVRFELDVTPESGEPFKGEMTAVIEIIHVPQIQPGKQVAVMYDPETKKVAPAKDENGDWKFLGK